MNPPLTLQKISPEQAKLCLQVKKFWHQYLLSSSYNQPHKILLALSGGADSTAMAVILYLLQNQLGITLCAVTINHKLRARAECDVLFVEHFCEKLGLEIHRREADVQAFAKQHKIGLEEAARTLRYAILEEIRHQVGAKYIAIAHNADDLCEDVLMRLCRGTGWPALGGMCAKDEQRKILRPILQVPRKQIESFLISLGISWQTDETNRSQTFRRNRFRRAITPKFQQENPNFHMAIQKLWNLAIMDAQFWDEYLNEAIANAPWHKSEEEAKKVICIGRKLLESLPQAAKLRLLIKAIKKITEDRNNIRAEILLSIIKTWSKGLGGKQFTLTKGLTANIKKGNIYIQLEKAREI